MFEGVTLFSFYFIWGSGGWVGSSRTHTLGGLDPAHVTELNAVGLKILLLSSSFNWKSFLLVFSPFPQLSCCQVEFLGQIYSCQFTLHEWVTLSSSVRASYVYCISHARAWICENWYLHLLVLRTISHVFSCKRKPPPNQHQTNAYNIISSIVRFASSFLLPKHFSQLISRLKTFNLFSAARSLSHINY